MCRFVLIKGNELFEPAPLLTRFSNMAEKSKAPDGDWQGDGWGVAWLQGTDWQISTSLAPIWEDKETYSSLPKTNMLLAHVRSASFPQHKGVLAYNQPYQIGEYVFVFNGLLRGVSLPNIPGRIGAEKIWYLVQKELDKRHPQDALQVVRDLLIANSREIVALNMGLSDKKTIYYLSYFTKFPQYYQVHEWKEGDLQIICSEQF